MAIIQTATITELSMNLTRRLPVVSVPYILLTVTPILQTKK
jgi:hypothetical protein